MSWEMVKVGWLGRTPDRRRCRPVVGSVTSVWFQVLRKPTWPPEKPNRSIGTRMLTDSWSSVPSPMLPMAERPPSSGMTSMASTISSWRRPMLTIPSSQKRRSRVSSEIQRCSGSRSTLPPITVLSSRSAEAAKSPKSSWPSSRSKRNRIWVLVIGVQVASRRGLAKKKLFSWAASPDWLMVEVSSRSPVSSTKLGRSRQVALPKASPRVSSTVTEADGRGTGAPPTLNAWSTSSIL